MLARTLAVLAFCVCVIWFPARPPVFVTHAPLSRNAWVPSRAATVRTSQGPLPVGCAGSASMPWWAVGAVTCLAAAQLSARGAKMTATLVQGRTATLRAHTSLQRLHTSVAQHAVKLTYFSLWAKGPSVALALEHSGMEWEGAFPDWKAMKETTPFLELPVLEVPEIGMIGHEAAILNYIGQQSPEMGGKDTKEFMVSQQLLCQAEDIYQKLSKLKAGYITGEDAEAFWTDENRQTHNRNFGVKVFLELLETFYTKCDVGGGKFTSSGHTVGECKLFATLHTLKLIKDDILAAYPGLTSFYDRFAADEKTQSILTTGGKMPGVFDQYFKF